MTYLARTRELAKAFHGERTAADAELRRIRNQFGAHREQIGWAETVPLWANVEKPVLPRRHDAERELFAFVSPLPVYEWFRDSDGTMNFMSPIPTGLFDE